MGCLIAYLKHFNALTTKQKPWLFLICHFEEKSLKNALKGPVTTVHCIQLSVKWTLNTAVWCVGEEGILTLVISWPPGTTSS